MTAGAQLLNEVKRRHPKTVRLILSGFSDQEMILECIQRHASQFLCQAVQQQYFAE